MDFQLLNFHTSLSGTFPKKPDESSPNSDQLDNLTLDGEPWFHGFHSLHHICNFI